ncbi:MAG TPA: glycogen-binding domain-containing protein [Candidatus Paceibacterota bacterium]|nr:glycogen-binding domain-containing protein [Candidatus Paceibacterota bacterium]HRZ58184.1 glycogen-binding domain-containing protein [Candidatus Paceibacterota bacterium]
MAKSRKLSHRPETFTLQAPQVLKVLLAGSFTDWEKQAIPLQRESDGTWTVTISLPPGNHEYLFIVDGQWYLDPACSSRVPNRFGTENMLRQIASS